MSHTSSVDLTSAFEAPLSQSARVANIFVAPTRTFRDILRDASWWFPFLLAVLMTLATTVTIDRKVGFERVVETQVHSTPKQEESLSGLSPEARAVQIQRMSAGYRYASFGSPVFILAFSALGALILWGTLNFGLGAHTTYAQMLAVWFYASLPRLLSGALTMLSLAFGSGDSGFDLKNPVGTNLAYYLPDLSPTLRATLSFIDAIGLWNLVLLVIGCAIVARVSRGAAAAVVLSLWLLGLLASVGSTAAFG